MTFHVYKYINGTKPLKINSFINLNHDKAVFW